MGRRGPKPQPTAILQLRGSWRAKGGKRRSEPHYAGGAPRKPRGMGRLASAEWDRVARHLDEHGLVKEVDRAALEAYCNWYEIWRKLLAALRRKKIGTTEYSRVQSALSDAYANMMRAGACFGMTPADRSKVTSEQPQEKADPLDEFLNHGQSHKKSSQAS